MERSGKDRLTLFVAKKKRWTNFTLTGNKVYATCKNQVVVQQRPSFVKDKQVMSSFGVW